jgi:hypothetical protein
MTAAFSDAAPIAVAVSLSPLPIIAVILVLLSPKPRSNGVAFLLGWILGLAIAEAIALAAVIALDVSPGANPSKLIAWLKLVVGVVLAVFGVLQWRRRPAPGQEPAIPDWMRSMETLTPGGALRLATLLSIGGNLALIVAAAVSIARAKLNTDQVLGAWGAFFLIGSLTIAAVVGYHVIAGQAATRVLATWKIWLLQHNATLTSALLIVVGALLVGKGISALGLFG